MHPTGECGGAMARCVGRISMMKLEVARATVLIGLLAVLAGCASLERGELGNPSALLPWTEGYFKTSNSSAQTLRTKVSKYWAMLSNCDGCRLKVQALRM